MKTSTIAIVGIIVALVVIVGVYFSLSSMPPSAISPTSFQGLVVNGGPEQNIYSVAFSLMDDNQKNGPAQGTVVLEILDNEGVQLYSTTKQLATSDFTQNDAIIVGSRVIGYSWSFPASSVSSGVPTSSGKGQAKITFASSTGRIFTQTQAVSIPALPRVMITSMEYDSNSLYSMQLSTPDLSNDRIYIGRTFSFPLTIVPASPINVKGITATTSGFTVLSISPTLPKEAPTSGAIFTLNVSAPSIAYEGELTLYINAESAGVGSFSFDSYSFIDSAHLTIYLRNTGTKTLVMANAFLDGDAASLSPQGHNLGVGQVYGYTITFSSSVGSGGHQLRIVASDGTPLQLAVVRL